MSRIYYLAGTLPGARVPIAIVIVKNNFNKINDNGL
jgi:hypothetical protein